MGKKLKTVTAVYSGLDTTLDRELKNAAGRWFDNSGTSTRGQRRDLSWRCPTESAAKALRTKLRKVKYVGLEVNLV